jgi:hypothetical protein
MRGIPGTTWKTGLKIGNRFGLKRSSVFAAVFIRPEFFGDSVTSLLDPQVEGLRKAEPGLCMSGVGGKVTELVRVGFGGVEFFLGTRLDKEIGLSVGKPVLEAEGNKVLMGRGLDGVNRAQPCKIRAGIADVEITGIPNGSAMGFVIVPIMFRESMLTDCGGRIGKERAEADTLHAGWNRKAGCVEHSWRKVN